MKKGGKEGREGGRRGRRKGHRKCVCEERRERGEGGGVSG